MSMLCKSVKPQIFRAVKTCSRQFSTNSNDFVHSEHNSLEKEGSDKYLPLYKKMNYKELSELMFIHRIPDSSLTPYMFAGPDASAVEDDNHYNGQKGSQYDLCIRNQGQTFLSSMEEFLSQYHESQKLQNSLVVQSLKDKDEINLKDRCDINDLHVEKRIRRDGKLALDGRQLDALFGVDGDVHSSSSVVAEDSFYNVTDVLNQCLHSAGQNINRLFNTEPFTLQEEETCTLLTANVDSSDNELLHNIVDPVVAFRHSFGEGNGDMHGTERHLLGQMFMNSVNYCVGGEGQHTPQEQNDNSNNLPNLDQLRFIQDYMAEHLPLIFSQRHDYGIYRQDLVFENNWVEQPYTTVGLVPYSLQLLKLRFKIHLNFANVRASVLKITVHEEDGTVRIRWRVSGLPQMRALKFWKFMPWNFKDTLNEDSQWHDGFSVLSVSDTGHIYKHTMNRVMSDEETIFAKEPKEKLVDKLKKIATPVAPAPT